MASPTRTVCQTIWQYRGVSDLPCEPAFLEVARGSALLARLLYNRGITTPEDVRAFLDLERYAPVSGLELPDMAEGVERTRQAIRDGENILLYGDFDVDGQTGTALLLLTLRHLGARVSFYIPDRASEGHGLNTAAVCRLASSRQIRLVITTDTGITNFNEISLLKGLGVDTVVTDHHDLPENLPPSLANINPKRLGDPAHPLYPLCGAGVAFKFCELLLAEAAPAGVSAAFAESLLDIAAIGTVADMVPLLRENRWLVWRGLQVMNRRGRVGPRTLLEQAGVAPEAEITSETIGFSLGPRLNALGRLERADDAVELLTTEDPEKARAIAARLEALNRRRQEMCEQTLLEAERFLSAHGGLDNQRAIVLASPDWHPGIIGLAATRLKDRYNVPVFLMRVEADQGEVRCSARSIPGFHLHDHLTRLSDYFLHFGGHAGAGGFALKLERLEAFKRDLLALCDREVTDEQMRPVIEVDARLDWHQLTPGLVEIVSAMKPFGQGNPAPLFVIENVTIAAQRAIGDGGNHLKLVLTPAEKSTGVGRTTSLDGLLWNAAGERFDPSQPYHFVVSPELNTFRNVTKLQLILKDHQKKSQEAGGSPDPRTERASSALIPAISRLAEVPIMENSADSPMSWIDHRSREGVEAFVGQLMLPLQESRSILLYHEGQKPQIPFLNETIVCTRATLRPADEVIFWDLPPDPALFNRILAEVSPRTVHLVGGKYQEMPVYPVGRGFLAGVYRLIQESAKSGAPSALETATLARQAATTADVVIGALVLLARMALVDLRLSAPGRAETVEVTLRPPDGRKRDVHDYLEFVAFQNALRAVGAYREFLLGAPLGKIKATLPLDAAAAFLIPPAATEAVESVV